jgi:hypothetical protein
MSFYSITGGEWWVSSVRIFTLIILEAGAISENDDKDVQVQRYKM